MPSTVYKKKHTQGFAMLWLYGYIIRITIRGVEDSSDSFTLVFNVAPLTSGQSNSAGQ